MENNFFSKSSDESSIAKRLKQLNKAKVGFYSIGLYPASLAYNCAMHSNEKNLLLAPRPGRELFGAFSRELFSELKPEYIQRIRDMSCYYKGGKSHNYSLSDLFQSCEIVVLSANSNHIENDLIEALSIRDTVNRSEVLIACLVGSFTYDKKNESPTLLCEKYTNLAFFSGFHRHGALRNPLDSFTANFCHPDPLNALLASRLINNLSPNIQVSAGVHNIEGQYIKAVKNISSIFAGFAHYVHRDNPGLLPTLLTLLLNQCLDQAATVSMSRPDRNNFYSKGSLPLTEIGYGVQRIEAAISKEKSFSKVRDHTFSQLIPMVADLKGSMMLPISGKPTRNFQVGEIMACNISRLGRCPNNLEELIFWCEERGLSRGALEGINSLIYLPFILKKYSIPYQESSMINLLYMSIFSSEEIKKDVYRILTNSRKLTKYCQESVRPESSFMLDMLFDQIEDDDIIKHISKYILDKHFDPVSTEEILSKKSLLNCSSVGSDYAKVKSNFIELLN